MRGMFALAWACALAILVLPAAGFLRQSQIRVGWGVATRLRSVQEEPRPVLLWRMGNAPVTAAATISFLQDWGDETAERGRAIGCTALPNGVRFDFTPLPGSTLDLVLECAGPLRSKGQDLRIQSRLRIAGGLSSSQDPKAQRLRGLVTFAAEGIIDAFNNEIGGLLMSPAVEEASAAAVATATDEGEGGISIIDEGELSEEGLAMLEGIKAWEGDSDQLQELLSPSPSGGEGLAAEIQELQRSVAEHWETTISAATTSPASPISASTPTTSSTEAGLEPLMIEGDLDDIRAFLPPSPTPGAAPRSPSAPSPGMSQQELEATALRRMLRDMQTRQVRPPSPPMGAARDDASVIDVDASDSFSAPIAPNAPVPQPQAQRKPDTPRPPAVRLEKFQGHGVEDQAIAELNRLVDNTRREGFLAAIEEHESEFDLSGGGGGGMLGRPLASAAPRPVGSTAAATAAAQAPAEGPRTTQDLFAAGANITTALLELVSRPPVQPQFIDDLDAPPTAFPVDLSAFPGADEAIDIFAGPPVDPSHVPASSQLGQARAAQAAAERALPPRPEELRRDTDRLEMLVADLGRMPQEMHADILDAYKDLYLSDNFLFLLKAANGTVTHAPTRRLLSTISLKASDTAYQLGLLVKSESVRHLETVHAICEVSARYQQDEAEFLDRLDMLRPRFDQDLLGYLSFAIKEEEELITAQGSDFATLPTQWLQVLRVVQRGVRADIERRFDRLLEPLLLVLRFEAPRDELVQERLFSRFVALTAPLDLPYMRELSENTIRGLTEGLRRGEFGRERDVAPGSAAGEGDEGVGGARRRLSPEGRRLLRSARRLRLLVDRYLSEDIVRAAWAGLEAEAAAQGKEVVVRHRNPVMQQQMDLFAEAERAEGGVGPGGGLGSMLGPG